VTEKFDPMHLLLEIKEGLENTNSSFEQHMKDAEIDRAHLTYLCDQVHSLSRMIMYDNGKDSILTKLNKLNSEVSAVREDTVENRDNIRSLVNSLLSRTPEPSFASVTRARWIAIGKIAGLLALAIPGLLAFFSNFG